MNAFAMHLLPPLAPPFPRFRIALARAAVLGAGLALCWIGVLWLLEPLFRDRAVKLAGDKLFREASWGSLFFVAVFWAPVFETLVAQWVPVSLMRLLSKSTVAGVLSGAAVFSVGHMLNGGGWEQGIITAISGAVFSWAYVRGLVYGMPGAIALTAVVHASNNALALCASALQAQAVNL